MRQRLFSAARVLGIIGALVAIWFLPTGNIPAARAQPESSAQTDVPQTVQTEPQADAPDRPAVVPLDLIDAVRRGGNQSEFFDRARYQEDTFRARRSAECSLLWPRLFAVGQLVRNDSEVALGDSTFVNLVDASGRIQLNANIFAAGDIPRCRAAGVSARAARQERIALERVRMFEIAQTYVTVLAAERQMEIAESARDLRATQLEAVQARREASLALQSDVSRASFELSRAEQDVVDSRVALDNAMDALAHLIGDPQGMRYSLEIPTSPVLEPVDETAVQVAARLTQDAAELRNEAAYWDLIPTLTLAAVANFGASSFRDPDGINWAITLALNWTIFDGGLRYATMDLTTAEIGVSQTDQITIARELAFDSARAERRAEAALERYDLSVLAEELAQQTYDDISVMYERGLATGLEQSEALSDLIAAQIGKLIDRLELALARLEFAYASGSLWPDGLSSLPAND